MAKFPTEFYFVIMTSLDGRAQGALLSHPSWMFSSAKGWCHWSSFEEKATIFQAEGTPDRFTLEIYRSFKNRQGGKLVGRPTWVYNAINTCFSYTPTKREATIFKLVSVDHGFILEILSSYKNRARGTDKSRATWMYNEFRPDLDGAGVFGYTSFKREATVFSIHTFKEIDEEPTRIVDFSFDMGGKAIHKKPYELFSATYINKGDTPLNPSWRSENTEETKTTQSFKWNSSNNITLGAKYSVSVEVTKLFATFIFRHNDENILSFADPESRKKKR